MSCRRVACLHEEAIRTRVHQRSSGRFPSNHHITEGTHGRRSAGSSLRRPLAAPPAGVRAAGHRHAGARHRRQRRDLQRRQRRAAPAARLLAAAIASWPLNNLWRKSGVPRHGVGARLPRLARHHVLVRRMAYYAGGETSVSIGGAADYGTVDSRHAGVLSTCSASAPALGRVLEPRGRGRRRAPLTAVISHDFWMRRFGGRAGRDRARPSASASARSRSSASCRRVSAFPTRTDIWYPAWVQPETHIARRAQLPRRRAAEGRRRARRRRRRR